eukprot:gene17648-19403_t
MDTKLSMTCIEDLSSFDSGVTIDASDSFVRNGEHCENKKIKELEATIVDLEDVIHKYKQQLDEITRYEDQSKTVWVKKLVQEKEELKKVVKEYSSGSEKNFKEDQRKLKLIESLQSKIGKLKSQLEAQDAKQLAQLKDVNNQLTIITKNDDDVKEIVKALLKKKSKDAQVDDDKFQEFVEFAASVTSLSDRFKDLTEEQQILNEKNKELEDVVEFMQLERICTNEGMQSIKEESMSLKHEHAKLSEEVSHLEREKEEMQELVVRLQFQLEFISKELKLVEAQNTARGEQQASLVDSKAKLDLKNQLQENEIVKLKEIIEILRQRQKPNWFRRLFCGNNQ